MLRALVAGFCSVPGPDRTGVQLRQVIRALAQRCAVDVLAARRGEQAYVERAGTTRILRVPIPDAPLAERAEAFRRAVRRQLEGVDYDLVHFRDGWTGAVALELRDRLRYATVFDVARGPMADPGAAGGELAALAGDEGRCAREADLVLAPTEPARRHIASLTRPERVRVVPPGVDVDRFDWDDPGEGPPRILYLGALVSGQGVRVLVRALLDVARRSDARLVLAGPVDPAFRDRLVQAASALGVEERLDLIGEVAHGEVPALIARSTVCAAPGGPDLGGTPTALFPTKILEYMACRRPVIAPRGSASTLLVRDGETGRLFTPGDPADLADKLLELLGDDRLRERIADGGYELVRRHHTASGTRREVRRAYDYLAGLSPWAERFAEAARRDESALSTDATMIDDDLEEGRGADPDFGDGSETGPEEITSVEAPSLPEEASSPDPLDEPLAPAGASSASGGEPWVVEDSLTRELEIDDAPLPGEPEGPPAPPVESVFVAGEVEIPGGLSSSSPERDGDPFTAVGPLLGADTERRPRKGPGEHSGGTNGAD